MSLLSQFYPQGSAASGFIDVELLMVAGGGGGGRDYSPIPFGPYSGSGGGGGVFHGYLSVKPGSTCPIVIGAGGAGGGVPGGDGAKGGNTTITTPTGTYIVHGGGGGTGWPNPANDAGQSGGSGGGGCFYNSYYNTNYSTPVGSSVYGVGGSSATKNGSRLGSPGRSFIDVYYGEYRFYGGGAGGFGKTTSFQSFPSFPSPSISQWDSEYPIEWRSNINGSNFRYAFPGGPALTGLGNGGAGTPSQSPGGSGSIVISYPTQFAAASAFPGGTDVSPSTPGYRTYQFTAPGSITLP